MVQLSQKFIGQIQTETTAQAINWTKTDFKPNQITIQTSTSYGLVYAIGYNRRISEKYFQIWIGAEISAPAGKTVFDDFITRFGLQIRWLKWNKIQLSIETYFEVNTLSLPQLMASLRNQVFRITTLGITGFDTPISGRGLIESRDALNGIANVLAIIKEQVSHPAEIEAVLNLIKTANNSLDKSPDRNQFDYLDFTDQHLNKISDALHKFQKSENIPALNINHPISPDAPNLFSENAFNPDFFVPAERQNMSPEKVTLGAKLFRDNALSGDQSRSCISCHHPDKAFSDGLQVPIALSGAKMDRNTPSLFYSNYQHGQFWDMRSVDLEGQSIDVITNKDEMHGAMDDIAKRLNQIQYSFKTPTVRNSSKTASYMHNGGYATLEQVMDFYNKGGGQQFGFKLDNQTLPSDTLGLTPRETAKIIAFLKALDD